MKLYKVELNANTKINGILMSAKIADIVNPLKKKKLCFVLLCLFTAVLFFFGILHFNSSVKASKILCKFSEADRDALECLFRSLNHSSCSYVLFGNKPMAISSFLEIEPKGSQNDPIKELRDLSDRLCVENLKINRGWQVWKKYNHFFPSSNFFLLENRDSGCITLVMINKQNFLKIIEENIDLFREILGSYVTPSIVLERCLKSSNMIKDVLKNHDGLLGILLGFGRHNAQLFSRRMEIERANELRNISLTKNQLVPSQGFFTIEEEYRYINETLTGLSEIGTPDLNPLLMPLPGFMVDPNHPETQQLKCAYIQQYKKIMNLYKKGDFLEISLNGFCK